MACWNCPFINVNKIYSNDIQSIFKTYGVLIISTFSYSHYFRSKQRGIRLSKKSIMCFLLIIFQLIIGIYRWLLIIWASMGKSKLWTELECKFGINIIFIYIIDFLVGFLFLILENELWNDDEFFDTCINL